MLQMIYIMEKLMNGNMKKYIDTNGNLWNGQYIIINGQTVINPTENMLISNGYTEVVQHEKTQEELFQERKQAKIAQINEYDKSSNVNLFFVHDQPMWLDFDERSRILASISAYRKQNISQMTKIYGEASFSFPIEIWEEMLSAVEVYASECLNVTEEHKRAVQQAINDKELDAIDITQGYPEKLTFTPYDYLSQEGGD